MELHNIAVFTPLLKEHPPIAVVGRIAIVPNFLPSMRSNRVQQWKRNPALVRLSLQPRIACTRVEDVIHLGINRPLRVSRKISDACSPHWNSVVLAVASYYSSRIERMRLDVAHFGADILSTLSIIIEQEKE